MWNELARAAHAAGDEILLRQRGDLFEIRYNGIELMSNLNHFSEDVLAERSLRLLPHEPRHILVGGLGMGFTLRAVLNCVDDDAVVTVCELVPDIAEWNRRYLGHLADHPLDDPRVELHIGDVMALLEGTRSFDAILLDTDNGPDFLVREENGSIYSGRGLRLVMEALRPRGLASFWSATISRAFEKELSMAAGAWRRDDVALLPGRVDAMHHIYLAEREAAALRRAEAA